MSGVAMIENFSRTLVPPHGRNGDSLVVLAPHGQSSQAGAPQLGHGSHSTHVRTLIRRYARPTANARHATGAPTGAGR